MRSLLHSLAIQEKNQVVLDIVLQGNETSNYELEFKIKVNEICYLLVNVTTRRDPDGVTESSKNDCAVAAMAHELFQLVVTDNAPIFCIDVNDKVNEFVQKLQFTLLRFLLFQSRRSDGNIELHVDWNELTWEEM
eukprot:15315051-Ditylum_brightwellii.AAC.1